jgi:glutamate-1-semialdehyde 2,1-aminomutase
MPIEQPIETGARSVEMVERAKRSVAAGDSTYSMPRDGQELAVRRGEDATLWDQDGNSYADYCLGRGSLLFGHSAADVVLGVQEQLVERGVIFCLPHRLEVKVGEALLRLVPCAELVRFTCSGTEAVIGASRLARAYTGRDKILRCEGAYHGWGDLETRGAGIPSSATESTVLIPFNDLGALRGALERHSGEIAAVIIEPVLAHVGVIPPEEGYLAEVRELASVHGVLLIFDESTTGFRIAAGGAQERYKVEPDLCVLAGALGGGAPVACVAGTAEVMQLAVDETVRFAGSFAGAALSLSSADKVLDRIRRDVDPDAPYPIDHDAVYAGAGKGPGERKVVAGGPSGTLYPRLFEVGERLRTGFAAIFRDAGIACVDQGVGPMFSIFLGDGDAEVLRNADEARAYARPRLYSDWQAEMQRRGVYLHPSQWEPIFASLAHTDDDVDRALSACEASVAQIAHVQ